MNLFCEGLAVSYEDRPVLRECALSLRSGELVFLLGVNGAGKSTLLKSLAGLLPPEAGSVGCGGEGVYDLPLRRRARLAAYLPQSVPATDMTVLEYVLLGAAPHLSFGAVPGREWEERGRSVLALLGAEALAGRGMDSLSGGERQRAALAQVLLTDACFLLLDEPAAGLDVRRQHEFLTLVRALAHSRGKGVLVSAHDPNLALRYGDRVCVLAGGRAKTFERTEKLGALLAEALRESYGEALYYGPCRAFDWRENERGENLCSLRETM